jgi:DNA repair protein RadD
MLVLRAYQEQIVDALIKAFEVDKRILLQLPTGGGKTIIFAEIVRRLMLEYSEMRTLIVMHREILVRQTVEKMLFVWPNAPIGIACASVGEKSVHMPLTIASYQTLISRLGELEPVDLVIVDEAHHIPPTKKIKAPTDKPSQYHKLFDVLQRCSPALRILGVTATPFLAGHGYLYGDGCKKGSVNFFPKLTYQQKISALQSEGWLAPYRAKSIENIEGELKAVKKSNGDFALNELERVMVKAVHLESAVRAYQEFGENRRHCVIFAATIAHAEELVRCFKGEGLNAQAVHSELGKLERAQVLADFKSGALPIIINVSVLTEGWDEPHVDLILFCRPTLSTGLYVQMIGRGLRPCANKSDLLILDLSGNCLRHGDPDEPFVEIPSGIQRAKREGAWKPCPECGRVVSITALTCPDCAHEFPMRFEEAAAGRLVGRDLPFTPQKRALLKVEAYPYVSRAGNYMLRIDAHVDEEGIVSTFLDVEGKSGLYGKMRAKQFWDKHCQSEINKGGYPISVDEYAEYFDVLTMPSEVYVKQDGRYKKIVGW